VYNLDYPSTNKLTEEELAAEIDSILYKAKEYNLNTVFLQVRASGDAFYKSSTEPWSYWLSGKQGKPAPSDFDPLLYMVERGHQLGIEVHAWFNLFRAVSHKKFFPPTEHHVATLHPEWLYSHGNKAFIDPGVPEARDYLNTVVKEVILNYDIDGVHLDDYFYHQEISGFKINDANAYKSYNPTSLSKPDWRRDNVNKIIKGLNDTISKYKPLIKYGVSPFPVWKNRSADADGCPTEGAMEAYHEQFADTKKWIEEGWVDYLMPQVYWRNSHPTFSHDSIAAWWNEHSYDRHVYLGNAVYKVGTTSHPEWQSGKELLDQIKTTRSLSNIQGNGFYKASTLMGNPMNIFDSIKVKFYHYPSLPPVIRWKDSIPPLAPSKLTGRSAGVGVELAWTESPIAIDGQFPSKYVIYRFLESDDVNISSGSHIVGITGRRRFLDISAKRGNNYIYIVTSVDRSNNESEHISGVFVDFKD
jgi:uncharacterized lipoprotein YddW (UPF0748 family)